MAGAVDVTAAAGVVAVEGDGDAAGEVADVVAGEDGVNGTDTVVVAFAAGDVAPYGDVLADDVLAGDSTLATRTPTPSAAPVSSVMRGMFGFMLSSTQSGSFRVQSQSLPSCGRDPALRHGREPSWRG